MEHFYFFMLAKSVLKTKNASESASAPELSSMSRLKAIVKNVLPAIISLIVTYGMWLGIGSYWANNCKGDECGFAVLGLMVICGIPIAIVVFPILLLLVSSLLTKIGSWMEKPIKHKRKPKI